MMYHAKLFSFFLRFNQLFHKNICYHLLYGNLGEFTGKFSQVNPARGNYSNSIAPPALAAAKINIIRAIAAAAEDNPTVQAAHV
jgi:hypothetical protein